MSPPLSAASTDLLRRLLAREVGHRLAEELLEGVGLRLATLAGSLGMRSLDDLLHRLTFDPDEGLIELFVETVANGETSFFRDPPVFERLETSLIPELIESRGASRRLNVWSAACSTGEEPYSLLILLDRLPLLADWNIRVHATDLRRSCVEHTLRGVYNHFQVQRGIRVQDLLRHFTPEDTSWSVGENLRRRLTVEKFNLLGEFGRLPGPFDLILLRNVLIYLEDPLRRTLLAKVHQVLVHDGLLVLGASESALEHPDLFVTHDVRARSYRKK